jgi:hypothetical protein
VKKQSFYNNPILRVLFSFLGISLGLVLCYLIGGFGFFAGVWYKSKQTPENPVVVNQDDEYIAYRARRFDLPQVIQQYDQVINALPKVPDVYIKKGDGLVYSSESALAGDAPFSFLGTMYMAAIQGIYTSTGLNSSTAPRNLFL